MKFNLLEERWIPARRRSGEVNWIAPHGIAGAAADPVIALAWPRPDFRLAGLEFLIGLLATAHPPGTHAEWRRMYRDPPDPNSLRDAFTPFAPAFALDGGGPRFMQDLEDFDGVPNGVGSLLIEAPGENTIKRNTDLMVRRGRVRVMSRASAAMALFTLQTYAPSGGAGNRTSLRGGGPLTTLALPPPAADGTATLWQALWANVPLSREGPPEPNDATVFPWLAPTRRSQGGRATTPADAHALQAFWGMPRRIRLAFEDAPAICDLTGITDTRTVRSWRQLPWGVNYEFWGGAHPLSPCYRMKPQSELLFLHPQPGGIGYRHWLSVLTRTPDETHRVAPAVSAFQDARAADVARGGQWRLLAGGFDMDNMKARGFTESEIPVFEPADPARAGPQDALVSALVRAAELVAQLLSRRVKDALFGEKAAIDADAAMLAALRARFWDATTDAFFDAAHEAAERADPAALRADWRDTLERVALTLFYEAAPIDASAEGHPARVAQAARMLRNALRGYGKDGGKLFLTLTLVVPEPAAKPRGKKAA